jgi:hypothetical protein
MSKAAIAYCSAAYLAMAIVYRLLCPHFGWHGGITPAEEKQLTGEMMNMIAMIARYAASHDGQLPVSLADALVYLEDHPRVADETAPAESLERYYYIRRDAATLTPTSSVPVLISLSPVPIRRLLVGTYPLPAAIPHTEGQLQAICLHDVALSNVVTSAGGLHHLFGALGQRGRPSKVRGQ